MNKAGGDRSGQRRFGLRAYYLLGTLGFGVLDFLLHAPVRVALGAPLHRAFYYAALLGLGWLCSARPRWAPVVGIFESAANLILIFVGLWLPILSLTDAAAQGGEVAGAPFSAFRVVNAALAVMVLGHSLRRNQAALVGRKRL